ncbi:MAG: hypothetical protein ACJ76J_19685 [Thermoanaerobaculia bacterium]
MTQEEFEERRRALEERHRADVALMNEAHEARLRSLEELRQAGGPTDRGHAAPQASPPAPARQPGRVLDDLGEALTDLPEVFDKNDVARVLGYEPSRTTLLRALRQLKADGEIAQESYSMGGVTTRYRKLAPGE